MKGIRLYMQVDGGDIKPLDIPDHVKKALIKMRETPAKPYRNIPERVKNRVYECLLKAGVPMTYRQLMKRTGYSIPYLYSAVGALCYEKKVAIERLGSQQSRCMAMPITRKIKGAIHVRNGHNQFVIDEFVFMEDFGLRVSQKAAMRVLRLITRCRKPVSREKLLDAEIYSHKYMHTILSLLVQRDYLECITRKGIHYYRPSQKASSLESVL